MKNSTSSLFIYPYWAKFFGYGIVLFAVITFIYRFSVYGIFDLAAFSLPFSFGLIALFFSKERENDERVVYLKFRSLAIAVPLAAVVVSLINYAVNFSNYNFETDSWFSISAFEYLSISLVFAIAIFHFLKTWE
jgi:hypothetical protein